MAIQTALDSISQNQGSPFGFKNRVINGGMVIDQRNAGASITPTNAQYSVDRWQAVLTQASKYTMQQNAGSVSLPAGFTKYLGFTSSSAYTLLSTDIFNFCHNIEGYNVADLNWGTSSAATCTLSFWTRSSLTGTFGVVINNANATRTYPTTYTINSANTWEYKIITIPGDKSGTWATDNTLGIQLRFGLGVGSSYSGPADSWSGNAYFGTTGTTSLLSTNGATLYITGVQFERGSQATSFDWRPFGTELALCQRYYQKSYGVNIVPGTAGSEGGCDMPCNTNAATNYYVSTTIQLKVPMRGQPTIRVWDPAGTLGRVTDYTAGGLTGTNGRNSIWGINSNENSFYVINTQNAATFSRFHWDAAIEL